ncbi:tRNA synthetases class II-domain-containing protein [Hypoxylon sp. NC1633]|nr:tRNA synthetases class II-domain-containing protein [Hypoxylon sp. NC1633]
MRNMVRFLSNSLRRTALKCIAGVEGRPLPRRYQPILRREYTESLHDDASEPSKSQSDQGAVEELDPIWKLYKEEYNHPPSLASTNKSIFASGNEVTLQGFIGKRKDISSNLSFCDIETLHTSPRYSTPSFQIVSSWQEVGSMQHLAHQALKDIPAYSPVVVEGTVQDSEQYEQDALSDVPTVRAHKRWDIKLRSIRSPNPFPKDIVVSKDAVWPPKSRHLQLRFDHLLRDRLQIASEMQRWMSEFLRQMGFVRIDTPVLFKSTPEGAREFLVPTRRPGYAYALPQSPQQYKQILMAGGVLRYFQFAKCFRDEDHRADRQPEFTQLDLEASFLDGNKLRRVVHRLIMSAIDYFCKNHARLDINGIRHTVFVGQAQKVKKDKALQELEDEEGEHAAPQEGEYEKPQSIYSGWHNLKVHRTTFVSYHLAMKTSGSDKPDLRIRPPVGSNIYKLEKAQLPVEFVNMITSLKNPIVETCKFRLGVPPGDALKFIQQFMEALPNSTIKPMSPESTPAVLVYDSGKPLNGLSALGHGAAEMIRNMKPLFWQKCTDGDIIIIHARKSEPFFGGSTDLGRLRKAIYDAAVAQGLIPRDDTIRPVWVCGFPLFTPSGDEPGQGGTAGLSSTHHPFTAPLTTQDIDLLRTDPLRAKGDHYDLVINGVEVGGGSRRIHIAEVQEYVMRDVLKMTDEGVARFSHLLEALRSGCPPHAGFALGFERFLSVLLDVPVRDVMAFPKSGKGEDLMVGSPAKVTPEQQKMYHIFVEPEK